MMKNEKPILFSTPMIQAILAGQKVQTRRVVKYHHHSHIAEWSVFDHPDFPLYVPHDRFGRVFGEGIKCPYGKVGDTLWVREKWYDDFGLPRNEQEIADREGVYYRADGEASTQFEDYADLKWKPSIFMPRWASRINLLIKDIRVERLQDISEGDAKAEGVSPIGVPIVNPENGHHLGDEPSYKYGFMELWDKINGKKYPWESNPWLWVIEFEVMQ